MVRLELGKLDFVQMLQTQSGLTLSDLQKLSDGWDEEILRQFDREIRTDYLELIRSIHTTDYKTLIIDSVSQQQDVFLAQEMLEIEKKTKRSRYLPLYQEYRISTEEMKESFRILQELPLNVVIIAHDRAIYKNEDTGELKPIKIIPDMTPRVNDAISRLINVIAYLNVERSLKGEINRKLYVNSTGLITAKNRLNIHEEYLLNASWKDLVKE